MSHDTSRTGYAMQRKGKRSSHTKWARKFAGRGAGGDLERFLGVVECFRREVQEGRLQDGFGKLQGVFAGSRKV